MWFPQILQDDEGFYLGMELDGLTPGTMRACISVKGVKQLAHGEGMLYPSEAKQLQQQVDDLELRLTQSEAERVALSQELDSIDGLVKSRDMVVRKKMGRPKVKEAA